MLELRRIIPFLENAVESKDLDNILKYLKIY